MPPRNLNIIILALCASVLCYITNQRAKTAMFVGDALRMIDTYYVDPVDADDLLTAAMEGMTSSLDQYSQYIPPGSFDSFKDSISQEFAGVGIIVVQPPQQPDQPIQPVRVRTPLVGSPALRAGILPGDEIIGVNGEDVSSMDLQNVTVRLKGPVGTSVELTVRRIKEIEPNASNGPNASIESDASNDAVSPPTEELTLRVQREQIEVESVVGDYRDANDRWVYRLRDAPQIAYMRLSGFGEKTVEELKAILGELDNDFAGLIFDLRGNGGGLLEAAVEVSDMFLTSGDIVDTKARGGIIEDHEVASPATLVAPDIPMVVLIDGNSASASEIVSAALQDNGRAAIVGARSFGKGTVQNILPLQVGRSALRLTVARYYRPSGKNIHRLRDATEDDEWGVTPDEGLAVELDENDRILLDRRWLEASYPMLARAKIRRALQDAGAPNGESSEDPDAVDVSNGLEVDPQLRRAVEHLRGKERKKSPETQAA